ncbi:RusA family crossover junction endodeoxyribonuclease [Tsukamurella sp. DT100]|uniref:RusA family crossover junction endodeoxyribonuclease n=1 Tax=Tsukamurella sp. DT100 TaxID=3393415 RepID=UPI003CE80A1B
MTSKNSPPDADRANEIIRRSTSAVTTAPDLRFFAAGVPAPKGSKRHVGNGRMIESSTKLPEWAASVIASAKEAMPHAGFDFEPFETIPAGIPVTVMTTYVMPRVSDTPRQATDLPHVRKPDVDKLDRAVRDALTSAGVYADDNQVSACWSRKRYANPNEATGAWVSVYARPVSVELRGVA